MQTTFWPHLMKRELARRLGVAAACATLLSLTTGAFGQSVNFDFETGDDQGWGAGFGNDASQTFPIVNIGGSNRMEVLRDGGFQEAGRESGNASEAFFMALDAASANEAGYVLSYDWYVDTSPGNFGNFLQLGTYVNSGDGYYAQDFPDSGKDVELDGTQLASGQTFSGTVSETFAAKGFDLPTGQTFLRLGLIVNGDGANATVYFDNVSVRPVPEPATFGLAGLAGLGILWARRRRR